jgi:Cu(I)/Ag(I) efflux system membrane fusion protein
MVWGQLSRAFELDAAEGENVRNLREARTALERLDRDRLKLIDAFGTIPTAMTKDEEGVPLGLDEIPDSFGESFAALFKAYAALGEELASDDLEGAQKAAETSKQALKGIKADALPVELKKSWLNRRAELAKAIGGLRPDDLKTLREGFLPLSVAMEKALRRVGPVDGKAVSRVFCPMAFDDKGASWITEDREVRNPYFGNAMLKCGVIKETLRLPVAPAGDKKTSDGPVVPSAFRSSFGALFDAYAQLHDRLASDDLKGGAEAAEAATKAFKAVKPEGLPPELEAEWKTRRGEFTKSLAALNASDLKELRQGFRLFSNAMVGTLRRFGGEQTKEIHVFHCSMAFDGRGGHWISEGRDVRNPYYGSAMLKCGKITETLKRVAPARKEADHHE